MSKQKKKRNLEKCNICVIGQRKRIRLNRRFFMKISIIGRKYWNQNSAKTSTWMQNILLTDQFWNLLQNHLKINTIEIRKDVKWKLNLGKNQIIITLRDTLRHRCCKEDCQLPWITILETLLRLWLIFINMKKVRGYKHLFWIRATGLSF